MQNLKGYALVPALAYDSAAIAAQPAVEIDDLTQSVVAELHRLAKTHHNAADNLEILSAKRMDRAVGIQLSVQISWADMWETLTDPVDPSESCHCPDLVHLTGLMTEQNELVASSDFISSALASMIKGGVIDIFQQKTGWFDLNAKPLRYHYHEACAACAELVGKNPIGHDGQEIWSASPCPVCNGAGRLIRACTTPLIGRAGHSCQFEAPTPQSFITALSALSLPALADACKAKTLLDVTTGPGFVVVRYTAVVPHVRVLLKSQGIAHAVNAIGSQGHMQSLPSFLAPRSDDIDIPPMTAKVAAGDHQAYPPATHPEDRPATGVAELCTTRIKEAIDGCVEHCRTMADSTASSFFQVSASIREFVANAGQSVRHVADGLSLKPTPLSVEGKEEISTAASPNLVCRFRSSVLLLKNAVPGSRLLAGGVEPVLSYAIPLMGVISVAAIAILTLAAVQTFDGNVDLSGNSGISANTVASYPELVRDLPALGEDQTPGLNIPDDQETPTALPALSDAPILIGDEEEGLYLEQAVRDEPSVAAPVLATPDLKIIPLRKPVKNRIPDNGKKQKF